jgi:PAS domain S-box-containing protein
MVEVSRIDAARHGAGFSQCAAYLAIGIGLAVLVGWLFDVTTLKSILPGLTTLKPNTAVGIVLCGIALWLLSMPARLTEPRARIGFACAGAVVVVALLTLAEYSFGWDVGIDRLLFRDAVSSAGASMPGRMSINSAVSFLLIGSALLTINLESADGTRPTEWLALIAALISYLALLGYLYGVESLQRIGPYASMALHAVMLFLVLCAGILFARPDRGLIGLLTTNSAGAVMGRRLLPAAVLIPPLLGWLRTLGQEAGWYGSGLGRAMLVASVVIVFTSLIWRNVWRLNRVDADRLRATRQVREGRELLQAIVDNSPAVIYAKDLAGRYLMVNRRFAELFPGIAADAMGKTDHDLFSKQEADIYRAMDQRVAATGNALTGEEQVTLVDGPHTFISVKAPLRDHGGDTYAIFGISTDITERKVAESERAVLLDSERRAREDAETLNEVSRAIASKLELHEIVQIATDSARRLTGAAFGAFFYNVLDEQGESYLLFTLSGAPRGDFEKFGLPRNTPLFETTFRGHAPVRLADVHEDVRYGKSAPHHGMPQGHPPVCSYLAVPVISQSGEVLGGLFFGHPDRDVFTERAERMTVGIAAQSSIAIDNARLHLEARQKQTKLESQLGQLGLLDHITRAIAQKQDLPSILQVVIRMLEERLPIDFGCVCLSDASNVSLTLSHIGAKSESLGLRLALIDGAQIDVDQNGLGRCVKGELVYEPNVSTSRFSFPQRLFSAGLSAFVAAPLMVDGRAFGVLIAARNEASSFGSVECEFLRQLSEHVALAAHQAQLHGALQRAYDELHQTQQTMLQQERLRAFGQMASGIAHDINNALTPAALYAETLLEREPGLSDRARSHLGTIRQAIEDVAQTVGRLREFYRPREPELSLVRIEINSVIEHVIELTRARWSDMPQAKGRVIEMRAELAENLPAIMGAESEIRDGLTNLIFNAVDAMPEGGTLGLRTRYAEGYVFLEVRDTGTGMDEETRRRCLEPFFTTKGERGTGLGLAMVYGMVQRHSGDLGIDSQVGKGTTMRIRFRSSARLSATVSDLSKPMILARKLRILVVDDDPLLLLSLRDVLQADGHTLTTAGGGREGIDIFVAAVRAEPFDVVITDLGMPHFDGSKVAVAVYQAAPMVPIILLTGWGQRLLAENVVPPHVSRVLTKPPKLEDLRLALAELTQVKEH